MIPAAVDAGQGLVNAKNLFELRFNSSRLYLLTFFQLTALGIFSPSRNILKSKESMYRTCCSHRKSF